MLTTKKCYLTEQITPSDLYNTGKAYSIDVITSIDGFH